MELNDCYMSSIKKSLKEAGVQRAITEFSCLAGKIPSYNRIYSRFCATDRKKIKFFNQP